MQCYIVFYVHICFCFSCIPVVMFGSLNRVNPFYFLFPEKKMSLKLFEVQFFCIRKKSSTNVPIHCEVKQGCHFSPLLFNITLDWILTSVIIIYNSALSWHITLGYGSIQLTLHCSIFSFVKKKIYCMQNAFQTIRKIFKKFLLTLIYLGSPKTGLGLTRNTVHWVTICVGTPLNL